ncbi:MAG: cytochrome d ubiquinol oxidase subunit II [Planctomycetota bacterium]
MMDLLSHDALTVIWFVLLGVLLIGYAILDGFDLGVGIIHPFVSKSDTDRRLVMNSIGPLWDGNEVWLITFGGALFAAFPHAYSSVFSGFYTAFMLLLFALIFRAVSLEFRSKVKGKGWRTIWDYGFFGASLLAALLFGVAGGNLIAGMNVDEAGIIRGTVLNQLWHPETGPYPLVVGLMTVALFAMHGSIYLYLKTEGELQASARKLIWVFYFVFAALFVAATAMTLIMVPTATGQSFHTAPLLWLPAIMNVLAILNIPRVLKRGNAGHAFVNSCCVIAALAFLFAAAIFPNFVIATGDVANSVNIWNARSSQKTLMIMLIIAVLGLPFVLSYTACIYWVFRGKVKLDHSSY